MIIEYRIFGIIAFIIFFSASIFCFVSFMALVKECENIFILIIAGLCFLVASLFIPIKNISYPIAPTNKGIVGNYVIFEIDKTVKFYNDINTLHNINNVTFRKVIPTTIFGYSSSSGLEDIIKD